MRGACRRGRLSALAASALFCGVLAGALPAPAPAGEIPGDRGDLVPRVPSGIGVGMAMNYDVKEKSSEAGLIDYVWGASAPPAPASVYNTAYLKYARDQLEVHPISWWKANHPTWV